MKYFFSDFKEKALLKHIGNFAFFFIITAVYLYKYQTEVYLHYTFETKSYSEDKRFLQPHNSKINIFGPAKNVIMQFKTHISQEQHESYLFEKVAEMVSYTMNQRSKESIINAGVSIETAIRYNTFSYTPNYTYVDTNLWEKEKQQLKDELPGFTLLPEVFYYHHGLRFCHPNIRNYVRNGDILDIGAYLGDSAILLTQYTDKKIYSYELSPTLIQKIRQNFGKYNQYTMKKSGSDLSEKVVLINKGVSEKEGTMEINDIASDGGSIQIKGNVTINITSIDSEVQKRNITPRFIKGDVEGVGLDVLKGGKETIAKYRPVIQMAMYHSYEEFFGMFEFMRQFPNYLVEFHCQNTAVAVFGELNAFFYPAEIVYDTYPQDT